MAPCRAPAAGGRRGRRGQSRPPGGPRAAPRPLGRPGSTRALSASCPDPPRRRPPPAHPPQPQARPGTSSTSRTPGARAGARAATSQRAPIAAASARCACTSGRRWCRSAADAAPGTPSRPIQTPSCPAGRVLVPPAGPRAALHTTSLHGLHPRLIPHPYHWLIDQQLGTLSASALTRLAAFISVRRKPSNACTQSTPRRLALRRPPNPPAFLHKTDSVRPSGLRQCEALTLPPRARAQPSAKGKSSTYYLHPGQFGPLAPWPCRPHTGPEDRIG